MSTTNGGWKPSGRTKLTCPESGQEVWVKRPDQAFWIKAGRTARTFSRFLAHDNEDDNGLSAEERGLRWLASASDEELGSYVLFAKQLVVAMCDGPKLVLNPREGHNEIGPDDLPSGDFWFLLNYGMTNFMGIKVPVGNTEVEVSDLESFRAESSVSGDGLDGSHVPPNTQRDTGD